MFIEIQELEKSFTRGFREEFSLRLIDFGEEVRQRSPLKAGPTSSRSISRQGEWCRTSA